jgi:hypothetical protein
MIGKRDPGIDGEGPRGTDTPHRVAKECDAVGEQSVATPLQQVRVRPETLSGITELSEHQADGGEAEASERGVAEVFLVLGETATASEPADGAFDDPALGQHDEAFGLITAADDVGDQARQGVGQTIMEHRAGTGAVGKQLVEKRELSEQRGQDHEAAIAILNIGGGDQGMQQQSQIIDENVALLALDQLAAIKPVRINAAPPFSALFTLWLSMMQAVGLASRSACSRHLT